MRFCSTKGPRDVHDLFAMSEVAEPELAKRARKPRTYAARPIHISGYDRNVRDFYATPDWVTGAITTVLRRHGYDVTSTDIADHGFGTPGVDFLSCQAVPDDCRALITN